MREVEEEFGWMYQTKHTTAMGSGTINFTIWSDVLVCPECGGEVVFWDAAVNESEGRVKDDLIAHTVLWRSRNDCAITLG